MLVYKLDSEESQVWYLIVSIPDLCTITYFFVNMYPIYLPFFMTFCLFIIVDSQWIRV